jgi:hypothetical protein
MMEQMLKNDVFRSIIIITREHKNVPITSVYSPNVIGARINGTNISRMNVFRTNVIVTSVDGTNVKE